MVLGTDFLSSWSLMWDSEELQTILSKRGTCEAKFCPSLCLYWGLLAFHLVKPAPIDQSYSANFKNQLKGSMARLWCLVGNSPGIPACAWVLGVQSQPSRAGHSCQCRSVPFAGTQTRDSSRAMPDPGAREITAKSPCSKCIWGSLTSHPFMSLPSLTAEEPRVTVVCYSH